MTNDKTREQIDQERDERIAHFDRITSPHMKSRTMLAAERDRTRQDIHQGFINTVLDPKYSRDLMAINVIVLNDTDAIIEAEVVGPRAHGEMGEKHFRLVIDNKNSGHLWEMLEDAMLFYVCYKLEGREAAMNGDFVRYARRMLRPE